MKCLKCGYVTSESKDNCARCGSPLPPPAQLRTPARMRPQNHAPVTPNPEPEAPLPDWRKEVSRKVKEYGEKKRSLTTPPGALKQEQDHENVAEEPKGRGAEELRRRGAGDPGETAEPPGNPRQKVVTDATLRVEPKSEIRAAAERSAYAAPSVSFEPEPRPMRPPLIPPPPEQEIRAGDLDLALDDEPVAGMDTSSLLLSRRAAALAVDSTILIALHAVLLYLCAEIISYNFRDLFVEAWLPLTGIFLLFHCLYYAYFYKTSRQTPGQVFFGIELRDPGAGAVPFGRVLGRWFALVFLNVFNLAPLLMGRPFLLLDRLSSTEIRTLK